MRGARRFRLASWTLLLASSLAAGCTEPVETGEGGRLARYEFRDTGAGFEVAEKRSGLLALLSSLFGFEPAPKIRVGASRGGDDDYDAAEIGVVLVRKRKLVGPEAKPTAMRRPWEVRLRGMDDGLLPPSFRFRMEAEAEAFANAFRSRLAAVRDAGISGAGRSGPPLDPSD